MWDLYSIDSLEHIAGISLPKRWMIASLSLEPFMDQNPGLRRPTTSLQRQHSCQGDKRAVDTHQMPYHLMTVGSNIRQHDSLTHFCVSNNNKCCGKKRCSTYAHSDETRSTCSYAPSSLICALCAVGTDGVTSQVTSHVTKWVSNFPKPFHSSQEQQRRMIAFMHPKYARSTVKMH